MTRPTVAALSTALAIASTPLVAQTPVALTKPDATFEEPFTQVAGIRELPNGKVLVSDMRDKVVQLIDFASGTTTKIGREGQGPGEYALPASLIPMPNGITWINDVLGRRFLVVDGEGKVGKTVQLPNATGGGFVAIGGIGSQGDGKGSYYFSAPPFNPANPGGESPDSLAILRWDGVKTAFDTVAWINGPKASMSSSGSGGSQRVSIRIGTGKVFAPEDAWGVAADGSIARVTPNPYRVTWYRTAKPAAGPSQAYTPLKVTEADKQEVIEQRKRARPMMVAIGAGGRQVNPGNVQLPEPEFEETKPPFSGPNSVVVSPEGEVWVRRTQPAGTKAPAYDVFDKTGRLVGKVTLNPNSVIRGFGKGTIYVVRTDEDDLQYLERYKARPLL